ncbi:glycoside hydrolase family 78 protein [Mucilaginibacter sp.]
MKLPLFCLSVFVLLSLNTFAQSPKPTNLKCEYLINPIGMDATHPRFIWQLKDDRAGAFQSGYQLFVSTDSLAVKNGKGNVWQTAKVTSAKNLVSYQGKALQPFTKYYWTVCLWDKTGKVTKSASVASFETGLMGMHNWKGYWISDDNDIKTKPAGYFRKTFKAAKHIRSAKAYIAAAGLYELYINGKKIGNHRLDPMFTRFDRRNLYVSYDVTNQLQDGKNAIGVILGNGWYNFQSLGVWDYERAPLACKANFLLGYTSDLH